MNLDHTRLTKAATELALNNKKQAVWLVAGIAAIVLLIVLSGLIKQSHKRSADFAASQLVHAVIMQDAEEVDTFADLKNLSLSVLNQVYTPQLEARVTTPGSSAKFELTSRIADLVIPSLAKTLEQDLKTAVAAGSTEPTDNLILQRIWADFSGGNQLTFLGVEGLDKEKKSAIAKLNFVRKDLEHNFTLTLALAKTDQGTWEVVDVPDFGLALNTLLKLSHGQKAANEAKRMAAMDKMFRLVALSIALRPDTEDAPALVTQIAFENKSDKTLAAFSGNLKLIKGETTVKSFAYGEQQELAPGDILEQAIPLPLDAEKDHEIITNFAKLKAIFQPVAIQFTDGTGLNLAE